MSQARFGHAIVGLLGLLLLGTPALAADANPMFDVAFGGTLTTDYMSRGTTQTNGEPAAQGYIEADLNQFYVGGFVSNVNYGFDDTEFDLSGGWRPEVGKFSFDFGAIGYFYAHDSGTNYGEIYAQVDYAANDWLTVGGKLYYGPDYVQSGTADVYGEGNTEISLPWNFSLSGAVGYQSFEESYGPSYWTWNAGLSWVWKDTVKFDVRYWDTNLSGSECAIANTNARACDARVVGSISVDTAFSALKTLTGVGSAGR